MTPQPVQTWDQKHAADFKAIHEAVQAVATMDLSGTTHTDWLLTVRTVRDKVHSFGLFIPHADKLEDLLNRAEKVLLGYKALQNLGTD